MTLFVRNSLQALAFSVLLLLVIGYGLLSTALISSEGWGARIGAVGLPWLLIETALALAVSLTGFVLMRRAYRKSSAPELFFFALFLFTLAGEALLLIQAWLHFQGSAAWFSGLLTRVIWAVRFFGMFLLLCASLFTFDFPYRKYGNLVAASLASAIFLASALPLHTTSARNHLLFAIGDSSGVVLFTSILAVAVAVNFVLGALQGKSDAAKTHAGVALFFLAGWALAIVAAPWGTIAAVPGIVLAAWKSREQER